MVLCMVHFVSEMVDGEFVFGLSLRELNMESGMARATRRHVCL